MKIDKGHLLGEDFEGFDSVYMTAIAKSTDYALRHQIQQYAKLKSQEYGEDIQVIFMDEEKVDRIIDLGLREYLRLEGEERWRRKE